MDTSRGGSLHSEGIGSGTDDDVLLESAVEHIRSILGDSVDYGKVKATVIKYEYDGERALDAILSGNSTTDPFDATVTEGHFGASGTSDKRWKNEQPLTDSPRPGTLSNVQLRQSSLTNLTPQDTDTFRSITATSHEQISTRDQMPPHSHLSHQQPSGISSAYRPSLAGLSSQGGLASSSSYVSGSTTQPARQHDLANLSNGLSLSSQNTSLSGLSSQAPVSQPSQLHNLASLSSGLSRQNPSLSSLSSLGQSGKPSGLASLASLSSPALGSALQNLSLASLSSSHNYSTRPDGLASLSSLSSQSPGAALQPATHQNLASLPDGLSLSSKNSSLSGISSQFSQEQSTKLVPQGLTSLSQLTKQQNVVGPLPNSSQSSKSLQELSEGSLSLTSTPGGQSHLPLPTPGGQLPSLASLSLLQQSHSDQNQLCPSTVSLSGLSKGTSAGMSSSPGGISLASLSLASLSSQQPQPASLVSGLLPLTQAATGMAGQPSLSSLADQQSSTALSGSLLSSQSSLSTLSQLSSASNTSQLSSLTILSQQQPRAALQPASSPSLADLSSLSSQTTGVGSLSAKQPSLASLCAQNPSLSSLSASIAPLGGLTGGPVCKENLFESPRGQLSSMSLLQPETSLIFDDNLTSLGRDQEPPSSIHQKEKAPSLSSITPLQSSGRHNDRQHQHSLSLSSFHHQEHQKCSVSFNVQSPTSRILGGSIIAAKPSLFARVLCLELRQQTDQKLSSFARNQNDKLTASVVVFDFSSPSPDDRIAEKQRQAFTTKD